MAAASGPAFDQAEILQQAKYVVIVALRHRLLSADPGEQILIALLHQGFVAVELRGAERRQMAIGEAAEQQVALQAAAIAALMEQALAADGNRFVHDQFELWRRADGQRCSQLAAVFQQRAARRRPGHDAADALRPLLASVSTLRGVGPGVGAVLGRLLGVDRRAAWICSGICRTA